MWLVGSQHLPILISQWEWGQGKQEEDRQRAHGKGRGPWAGTDLPLQVGHLFHSFHSSWERFKVKEEVLRLPDADGLLLRRGGKKSR